jgi:hypothetical protein
MSCLICCPFLPALWNQTHKFFSQLALDQLFGTAVGGGG